MGKLWEPGEIYTYQRGPRKHKAPHDRKKPYRLWRKIFWQSIVSLLIFLLVWGVFQLESRSPLVESVQGKIRVWFSEDSDITPVIKFFNDVGLWGDTFERAAFEASSLADNPGLLAVPVSGQISKPFGWIVTEGDSRIFHDGIVITAAEGTPIKAAMAGMVTRLANEEEKGRVVEIKSEDDRIFTYGHCQEILVNLNDQVNIGQVIAKVGKTGTASSPQLYFRITEDGEPVDPAELFIPSAEKI